MNETQRAAVVLCTFSLITGIVVGAIARDLTFGIMYGVGATVVIFVILLAAEWVVDGY